MLLDQKDWVVYFSEGTEKDTPDDRAHKSAYMFFERDGKLMGQFVGRVPGYECLDVVTVRDDGFNFRICPYRDQPETKLDYDPADGEFPFKRVLTPTKWWFAPKR